VQGSGFSINLSEGPRRLVWTFRELAHRQATGLLVLRYGSGGSDLRKEIAFSKGEPIAVTSNRSQERLSQFLLKKGVLARPDLDALAESGVPIQKSQELVSALLSKSLLNPPGLPDLMSEYFSMKLFDGLTQVRGQLEFKPLEALPEKVFQIDEFRLTAPFLKALWDEAKLQFDMSYCRALFSKEARGAKELKVTGDFPLPLGPLELRHWNELLKSKVSFESLSHLSWQLLAVANEFETLSWVGAAGDSHSEALPQLLKSLKKKKPWEVLEIERTASADECKKAYFKLIKKLHPDRLPESATKEEREHSESIMALVNEAYDTWSDPEKREEFEAQEALDAQGGVEGIHKKVEAELAFERGFVELKRKQFGAARKSFSQAADEINDPVVQAASAFAQVMDEQEQGSLDGSRSLKAWQLMAEALKTNPGNAWLHYAAGMILKALKKDDQALSYFDKTLELDSSFQDASMEARLIRGRREKASTKSSWFKKGS